MLIKPQFPYNIRVLSLTVKAGQGYTIQDSIYEKLIDSLKNELVSCSCNWCRIQISIPRCITSSENFTRTFLYLVILKVFEWIKFLRRHLHQIQGNRAGRNFVKSCIACDFMAHYACKNAEMNLKSTTTNGFNFQIINSLMESWRYA